VTLDERKFFRGKSSGSRKNFRWSSDLADVVEIAGNPQSLLSTLVKPSSAPRAAAISPTRHTWPAVSGSRISPNVRMTATVYVKGGFYFLGIDSILLFNVLFLRNI